MADKRCGVSGGGVPSLRSPWMMPRECRKAMPDAISAAVISSVRTLGLALGCAGGVRNAPRWIASCAMRITSKTQRAFGAKAEGGCN